MITEEVLDIMEPGASVSEQQKQKLKEDADLRQACEDIHIAAHLLRQQKEDFDVEEKLEQFNKNHQFQINHQHRKSMVRRMILAGGIAVAAAILWVVFFVHPSIDGSSKKTETDLLFAANEDASQPVLTNSKGKPVDMATYLDMAENPTTPNSTVVKVIDDETIPLDTLRLTIPYGKDYTVELPDGSKVKLRPGSRISYPTRFVGSNRQVALHGEAYFMVAKDEKKPFVVKTGNVYTRVLGTEFNIKAKNEHEMSASEITLVKGSVEVWAMSSNGQPSKALSRKVLKPGQQAKLNTQFTNIYVEEVDTDPYTMWRDGYFYFDNINMRELLLAIGQRYNMSVVCHNKDIEKLRVRFIAERDSNINYIIEKINGLGTVDASVEDGHIVVR